MIDLELELDAGDHKIEIYGSEACCDGPADIVFKRDDGSAMRDEFIDLNLANYNSVMP